MQLTLTIDSRTALALSKALMAYQTEQEKHLNELDETEREDIRLIDENVLRVIYREARIQSAPLQDHIREFFSL